MTDIYMTSRCYYSVHVFGCPSFRYRPTWLYGMHNAAPNARCKCSAILRGAWQPTNLLRWS